MAATPIDFKNRVMENEHLKLDSKDVLYALGPNLVLRGCHITLRVGSRGLITPGVRFIDCTIEAKQELKNFRWYFNAFFKGCRFTGRYCGNDFGRWPDFPSEGGIEDCDFTEARLDGCRFVGCDASALRFPLWPHFTLLDVDRRSQELKAVQWPGKVHLAMAGIHHTPPNTAAVTFSAALLAKEFNVTEASIRAVVERLNGVIF